MLLRARLVALAFMIFALGTIDVFGAGGGYPRPSDPDLTPETANLYWNLQKLITRGDVLFGQNEVTLRGAIKDSSGQPYRAKFGDVFRADIKDVTGAYPAVHGFSIRNDNFDDAVMLEHIKFAFQLGAVVTVHWPANNPAAIAAGDKDIGNHNMREAVSRILPGGDLHGDFKATLDKLAGFFKQCRTEDGVSIPIIFRPWHEMNGVGKSGKGSHWWHSSPNNYKKLWKFTVDYLRNQKGLHNLLFAYAPSGRLSEVEQLDTIEEYLEYYPGSEYVDVMGIDRYFVGKNSGFFDNINALVGAAAEKGEIAAITEVGYPDGKLAEESYKHRRWWEKEMLGPVMSSSRLRKVAYMMTWGNGHEDYLFVGLKGTPLADDVMAIYRYPGLLFQDNMPDMYGNPEKATLDDFEQYKDSSQFQKTWKIRRVSSGDDFAVANTPSRMRANQSLMVKYDFSKKGVSNIGRKLERSQALASKRILSFTYMNASEQDAPYRIEVCLERQGRQLPGGCNSVAVDRPVRELRRHRISLGSVEHLGDVDRIEVKIEGLDKSNNVDGRRLKGMSYLDDFMLE